MAIKLLTKKTLGKSKAGWRWDKKRELWVTYQLDTEFNGKRHVRRGFRTEKAAQDYHEQLKTQDRLIEIGYAQPIKFPSAAELFEKHTAAAETRNEKLRRKRVFKMFLKLLPPNATIDEIERKHFKDYADRRIESGVKPETADREITPISSALTNAKNYYTGLDRWVSPVIYRPPVPNEGRDRVVSTEEFEKLIPYLLREKQEKELPRSAFARNRAGLILYFGLLTGLRHGEICRLEKQNFNRRDRSLKAERFKTKKSGIRWTTFKPLPDVQIEILERAAGLYPNGIYFFSEKGKIHNKFYDVLKAACKKFGIPYGQGTDGGLVMHDARHTFVTNLMQGGTDIATAKSLTAHSTNDMLIKYSHANSQSKGAALRLASSSLTGNIVNSEKLKEVFDAVRSGNLDFEGFVKELNSFTVF